MTLAFCITYFNEGHRLNDLMETVLAQDEGPDEILIYDDCSAIPPEGLPVSDKITLIRGDQNRGPAVGRNRLMEACSSEYIHFHDADDSIFPQWSRRIRQEIAEKAPDFMLCDFEIRRDGEPYGYGQGFDCIGKETDLLGKAISDGILTFTGIFKTEFLRKSGGFPLYWQSEDYALYIKLAINTSNVSIIRDTLNIRNQRDEGRGGRDLEVLGDTIRILEDLHDQIPASHRDRAGRRAFECGRGLFQRGDRQGCRKAFAVARSYVRRPYQKQFAHYVLVADLIGPYGAEQFSVIFRWLKGVLRAPNTAQSA